jgi:hypothetical protein
VFVDRSGRRRRLLTVVGAALGVALLASLGLLIAGMVAGSPVPIPGWPDSPARANQQHQPATPSAETTAPSEQTRVPSPATTTAQPLISSSPTATNPGQGDEHRHTPPPRPTRTR